MVEQLLLQLYIQLLLTNYQAYQIFPSSTDYRAPGRAIAHRPS